MRSAWADDDTIKKILSALMPANRLAVELSLATGLRISDVLSLTRAQVLKDRCTVYELKTGKRRQIRIPAKLRRLCIEQAGELYVFPNRLDGRRHRTRQTVWKDVVRAAKAFRVRDNVTPHTARKAYAVHQFEKCGDLEKVRKLLNHDRSATTAIYVLSPRMSSKRKSGRKKGKPR